jgi:RNA polymerase sigma-32 factor
MNKPFTNRVHGARRIHTPDMLSAEVERDLVRAWQDHGDRRARDRLLRAFAPLAISAARRFNRGAREPDPDLVQQANIGLMKAADRFDPERDIRFSTYAVWWVRPKCKPMRARTSRSYGARIPQRRAPQRPGSPRSTPRSGPIRGRTPAIQRVGWRMPWAWIGTRHWICVRR